MYEAVKAKFTQHAELRQLLGTRDARIIKHTENDDYWGDGSDGKSMSGKILMKIREELR